MNVQGLREALFISVENASGQMASPGNMAPIMDAYTPLAQLLQLLNLCKIKGLRFAPTEPELMEYLADFVASLATGRDSVDKRCIPVVDLNKVEPRDIPGLCQTEFPGDKTEYYLFHRSTRKYPTSNRGDRSTSEGYWKATGRPTSVKDKHNMVIGERKTLVFYTSKNNKSSQNEGKTDWIMHEFRPAGHGVNPADATWVVCSVSYKPLPPPASPTESVQGGLSPGPASPLSSSTSGLSGCGNNPSSEKGRANNKNKSPPGHYDDTVYGSGLPSPASASSPGGGDNFLDQEFLQRNKAPRIETEVGNRPSLARSGAFVLRHEAASDAVVYRQEMVQQWPGLVPGPDARFIVGEGMDYWNHPAELPPAGYGYGVEVNEDAGRGNQNPYSGTPSPFGQALSNSLTFNDWRAGNNIEASPPPDMGLDGEGTADFPLWDFQMEGPAN